MIKQVCSLLRSTYTFSNNQQRRKAEQQLTQLQKQPGFLNQLVSLIMQDPNQDQRLSASTYLVKYTKDTLVRGTDQTAQQCGQAIIGLLQTNISYKYKVRIGTALQFVIEKLGRQFRLQLCRYVQEQLALLVKEPDLNNIGKFEQLVELSRLIMVNIRDDSSMNEFIAESVAMFVTLLNWAIGQLGVVEFPSPQFMQRLSLVKNLSNIVRTYFKLIKFDKNHDLLKTAYSRQLDEAILKILTMQLPQNPFGNNLVMGHDCQQANLMNALKQQSVTTFELIIRAITKNVIQSSVLSMNTFFCKSQIYINIFCSNLSSLLKTHKIHFMKSRCKELISSMIRAIDYMVSQSVFYEEFFKRKDAIYAEIIAPMLEMSPKEIKEFTQEPEEFVEGMIYMVNAGAVKLKDDDKDMGEDETVKALVAKLLNDLCRYQDGFILNLFRMCLQTLTSPPPQQNSLVFLLSLCIAQANVTDRQQLIIAMKLYIENEIRLLQISQVQGIQPQTQPSPTSDLQYFLKYFLVFKYTKDINVQDMTFPAGVARQLAVNVLGQAIKPCNQACQLICLQILSQVSQINTLAIYEQAPEILAILTKIIQKPQMSVRLFEHIVQLIRENCEIMAMQPSTIYDLAQNIVQRIQYEVANQSPTQSLQQNLILAKCWNCLCLISSTPCFASLIPQLEQIYSPVLSYISTPSSHPFYEQIIIISCSHIKHRMLISDLQFAMFEHLPKVFQKTKYLFYHLFELLNLYLYYGCERISSNEQAIKIVLEMGFRGMFVQSEQKGAITDADNCEGVLLLQNLVEACAPGINRDMWDSIVVNTLKRLNGERKIQYSFFKSNLVALLALCLANTLSILPHDTISSLLRKTLEHLSDFLQDYPTKVYSCSMTLVLRRYDIPAVMEIFVHLLDSLTTLLRINYSRVLTNQQDCPTKTTDEIHHQNSMAAFSCRLKQLDEYKLFKQTIRQVRDTNPDLFEKAAKELPREKQQYLKTIMGLEKVEGSNYRQILHVRKP